MKVRHLSIAYAPQYRLTKVLSRAIQREAVSVLTVDDIIGYSPSVVAPHGHAVGCCFAKHDASALSLGWEKEQMGILYDGDILGILLGDILVEEAMTDDILLATMLTGQVTDAANVEFRIDSLPTEIFHCLYRHIATLTLPFYAAEEYA